MEHWKKRLGTQVWAQSFSHGKHCVIYEKTILSYVCSQNCLWKCQHHQKLTSDAHIVTDIIICIIIFSISSSHIYVSFRPAAYTRSKSSKRDSYTIRKAQKRGFQETAAPPHMYAYLIAWKATSQSVRSVFFSRLNILPNVMTHTYICLCKLTYTHSLVRRHM